MHHNRIRRYFNQDRRRAAIADPKHTFTPYPAGLWADLSTEEQAEQARLYEQALAMAQLELSTIS